MLPQCSDHSPVHQVLIYDLLSRRMQEVPKGSLDLKSPTCVGFLFQGGQALPGQQPLATLPSPPP